MAGRYIFFIFGAAIGLFLCGVMGQPVSAQEKKVAPCDGSVMQLPAAQPVGAHHHWRLKIFCEQVWNNDFLRSQTVLEKGKLQEFVRNDGRIVFSVAAEKFHTWFDVGSQVIAVMANGVYTLIDTKTDQITPTKFNQVTKLGMTGIMLPSNVFLWTAQSGQPNPAYPIQPDGTVGVPIPGSDMRRLAASSGDRYCDGAAGTAAIPLENIPLKDWIELRRVVVAGAVDLSPESSMDANCEKFNKHLFLGRRRSDNAWQLVSAGTGAAFESVTYATAELAKADMIPGLQRALAADQKSQEIEAEKQAAANKVAAQKAIEDRRLGEQKAAQKVVEDRRIAEQNTANAARAKSEQEARDRALVNSGTHPCLSNATTNEFEREFPSCIPRMRAILERYRYLGWLALHRHLLVQIGAANVLEDAIKMGPTQTERTQFVDSLVSIRCLPKTAQRSDPPPKNMQQYFDFDRARSEACKPQMWNRELYRGCISNFNSNNEVRDGRIQPKIAGPGPAAEARAFETCAANVREGASRIGRP